MVENLQNKEQPKKQVVEEESGFDLKEALNPKEDLDEIMKAFDFYNDAKRENKNNWTHSCSFLSQKCKKILLKNIFNI